MRLLPALAILVAGLMAQPVPKLTPLDQNSYRKLIEGHRGKVIVANFWASWCVPCRKEMPQLVQLSQKLSARGFDLLMISADDPEQEGAALKVLKENRVEGPAYVLKTANKDAFYPTVDTKWVNGELPALFLYDRSGRRVRAFLGETSMQSWNRPLSSCSSAPVPSEMLVFEHGTVTLFTNLRSAPLLPGSCRRWGRLPCP